MFCKNCGKELDDSADFCGYCGTALKVTGIREADEDASATEQARAQDQAQAQEQEQTQEQEQDQAQAQEQAQEQTQAQEQALEQAQAQEQAPPPSRKRNRTIGIAVAIVAVVALAAIGIFAFMQHRAYEEAHAATTVTVIMKLPGYEDDGGTGVPLAINGVDLDGNSVSERVVVPSSGGDISLKRGTYTVQVVGLAASSEGHVYQASQRAQRVEVGERGAVSVSAVSDGASSSTSSSSGASGGSSTGSSNPASGSTQPQFEFAEIPLDQLTDDQIKSIGEWMADFGVDQAKIDETTKQVTAARQAEVDRIAEEQRKAEEERQRKEEEERQRREEEERQRAEAEAAARRDNLTGTYYVQGGGSANPNSGRVTFSGHEVTVVGPLGKQGGGSMGNKTWTFTDTDDTWYGGYAKDPGYIEYSRDEFESHSSSGSFPGISIELEDGVVKRMVISS